MAEMTSITLDDIETLHWFTRNTTVSDTDPEVLQQFFVYINSRLKIINQLVQKEIKKETCFLDQYTLLDNKFQETKHRFELSRTRCQTNFSQNYSKQLLVLNELTSLFRDAYNTQFGRVDRMMAMLTDIANFLCSADEFIQSVSSQL